MDHPHKDLHKKSFKKTCKGMGGQVEELQTLQAHTSDVTSCDFGPDCILATGSSDKTVRLWEWKPGLGYIEVSFSPLKEHKYGITYISFSPQGTMLASASRDGCTILWNARNGTRIHKFPQVNGDTVKICRFSSDSCNLVTGGDNGVVCIWDIFNRTLVRTIIHHEDTVQGLAYTIDSTFLLTTCTLGVMKLYSVSEICDTTIRDPTPLFSLDDAHDLGVLCCDFSNQIETDENTLTSCYTVATGGNDQCLRLWLIKSRREDKSIKYHTTIKMSLEVKDAHSCGITCVRFNQTGNRLVTSSLDKCIRIWNNTGTCLQVLDSHNRYVNCVSFSRDGFILSSGSNDRSVKIWDLTGGNLNIDVEMTKPCSKHSHYGCGDLKGISNVHENNMLLNPDSEESEVVKKQSLDNLHTAVINAVEFNTARLIATGSGDKTICLLQQDSNESYVSLGILGNHRYQVNNVTFISETVVASCSLDGIIALWKIGNDNTRPLHTFARSAAGVKCVRVGGIKNHLMAAYDDGTSALWSLDPLSTTPIVIYPEHIDAATSCALIGRLACSASHNGDFRLYQIPIDNNIYDSEPVYMQEAHDLGVQSIDFAPNHNDLPLQIPDDMLCYLLGTAGNDCYARIWKILIPKEGDVKNKVTCMEWRLFSGHGSSLTCIRFPPARSDLICTTSTDMQARIWSVYSGQCLHVLEHSALVASCSFSRNCELLATGCLEGQLSFWRLPNQLIYDNSLVKLVRSNTKTVSEWSTNDIIQFLKDAAGQGKDATVLNPVIVKVFTNEVTGKHLYCSSEDDLFNMIAINPQDKNELIQYLVEEIRWLRRPSIQNITINSDNVPHEFLCPITHDIMKDPVKCSDGFTYERRALNEWFLSGGKYISPMTNQTLYNSELTPNKELKKEIRKFILENME